MNKEEVLLYLSKEGACSSAIDWFIDQKGTLEEIYNECFVDWRIWLHYQLDLDCKPYEKYNAIVDAAYAQYQKSEIGGTAHRKIEINSWKSLQADTMKDWAVVEKALQEAIEKS